MKGWQKTIKPKKILWFCELWLINFLKCFWFYWVIVSFLGSLLSLRRSLTVLSSSAFIYRKSNSLCFRKENNKWSIIEWKKWRNQKYISDLKTGFKHMWFSVNPVLGAKARLYRIGMCEMDISSWFGFGGSFCAVLNVVADWAAVASTHQAQSSFRSLSSLRESLSSKKYPAQLKKAKPLFASSIRKLGAA